MARLYAGLTYEYVVRKYAQTVAGACVVRLQNYADAEDHFQNTFVKLLTKAPSFQDEKHLRHWLIKVAVNGCYSLLRFDHLRRDRPPALFGGAARLSGR